MLSARCPGKETANEDAAAVIPYDERSGVLVVADGLGGERSGELAADLAISSLQSELQEAARQGVLLRSAIMDGIEQANLAVQELGIGAATTLTVVEIHDGTARPYHVGDSMILAIGGRGKIKLQTISHSPIGFAVEAGFLNESEAMRHEDRHVVSNVVGTADMRIEVGSAVRLAQRDTLLLASDGLFDNLCIDEIVERVRKGPIDHAAQRLAADSLRRMAETRNGQPSKPDDLTVVAYRLRV